MGFLDNSGDIIIDAVLTDVGRERLARGDGTFRIVKFALGDDEINYGLFNPLHPSGSAYYDIEILQTPVLEAPTDNGAGVKHKLLSIPRNDLLYLPVVKLNETDAAHKRRQSGGSVGTFVVCVNENTENLFNGDNDSGIIKGENVQSSKKYIRVDQGLDTTEISYKSSLDDSLIETRYIVEIDNRFGKLVSLDGTRMARPNYIDDDNIASYNFALGVDTEFVSQNTVKNEDTNQVIAGPRGTVLRFSIAASLDLNSSNYYFNQLGGEVDMDTINGAIGAGGDTLDYIDTYVRIFGATTGRAVDIPVRYIRKQQ